MTAFKVGDRVRFIRSVVGPSYPEGHEAVITSINPESYGPYYRVDGASGGHVGQVMELVKKPKKAKNRHESSWKSPKTESRSIEVTPKPDLSGDIMFTIIAKGEMSHVWLNRKQAKQFARAIKNAAKS